MRASRGYQLLARHQKYLKMHCRCILRCSWRVERPDPSLCNRSWCVTSLPSTYNYMAIWWVMREALLNFTTIDLEIRSSTPKHPYLGMQQYPSTLDGGCSEICARCDAEFWWWKRSRGWKFRIRGGGLYCTCTTVRRLIWRYCSPTFLPHLSEHCLDTGMSPFRYDHYASATLDKTGHLCSASLEFRICVDTRHRDDTIVSHISHPS